MPTVANLAVSVTARTAKFAKGMKRAGRAIRDFGIKVAAIGKQVAMFSAALGGAAAIGLAWMTKRAFQSVDALAKMADRLGLTTEELIAFQHGATIMGSSLEGMNKGLEQFVRRLGEASTRSGETRDAFEMLGLDPMAFAAMRTAEAIKAVAERISQLPSVTQQAEAAYRLFGRRGVELVNFLKLGRKGVEDFRAEVERLGFGISRDAAAKVELANDAVERMRRTMVHTGAAIAANLAPYVMFLADRLSDLTTTGEGVGGRVSKAFEKIKIAIGEVANSVNFLKGVFYVLEATAISVVAGIVDVTHMVLEQIRHSMLGLFILVERIPGLKPEWRTLFTSLIAAISPAAETLNTLALTVEDLNERVAEATRKALDAYGQFATGTIGQRVLDWFKSVADWATKLAVDSVKTSKEMGKLAMIPFEELRKAQASAAAKAKITQFMEVSFSRTAIPGIGRPTRPQVVRDPQLEVTNRKLEAIRYGLSVMTAVTGI